MNPKIGLIDKIISGMKKIESRWYKHKRAPWNKIAVGDIVYFKNSGKPVTASAEVERVMQFELDNENLREIIEKYGGDGGISLNDRNPNSDYYKGKKYCILVFIKNPRKITPFNIDKKGFGAGSAWLFVEDINKIKK